MACEAVFGAFCSASAELILASESYPSHLRYAGCNKMIKKIKMPANKYLSLSFMAQDHNNDFCLKDDILKF